MYKTKYLALMVVFIFGISVSFLCISTSADQATQTSVTLSPATILGSSMSIGSTFTVNITINDVTNLGGWTASISWNPSVLQMQGAPKEGSFLKSAGSTMYVAVTPNNTLGFVPSINDMVMGYTGVSGSGILATMTFSVVSYGNTQISINNTGYDTYFVTPMDLSGVNTKIPVTLSEATFVGSTTSGTHGPIAHFTPSDGSTFLIGAQVPLDASSSQPGYDQQACNITNFVWAIEYLNGTTLTSLTGETATFDASTQGELRIVLIVTANDSQAVPDPTYTSIGSASTIIYIVSNPGGASIDVYTDKGGVGSNVPCGDYSPLELVQVYANVSYNNLPLSSQNVIFTMQNSSGSIMAVREGTTNESGIATAQFRLPSPLNSTQTDFGNWTITGTVNVTSVTISDSASFLFSYERYLSGIQNIQVPSTVSRLETLPIQFTIDSSYYPVPWAQLSVTVFDNASIPIGSFTIIPAQVQVVTVISSNIVIPSWAFTGEATVYICLLTNSSNSQLVPLSPESTVTFQVLS